VLSFDKQWLFSGSDDASIKLWRLADNTNTATLNGHTGSVLALALSADNQRLYSGSGDLCIKVWRIPLLTWWSEHRHHTLLCDQSRAIFELLVVESFNSLSWDDLRHVIQAWCSIWSCRFLAAQDPNE
jgi:WD40 repeat protein